MIVYISPVLLFLGPWELELLICWIFFVVHSNLFLSDLFLCLFKSPSYSFSCFPAFLQWTLLHFNMNLFSLWQYRNLFFMKRFCHLNLFSKCHQLSLIFFQFLSISVLKFLNFWFPPKSLSEDIYFDVLSYM